MHAGYCLCEFQLTRITLFSVTQQILAKFQKGNKCSLWVLWLIPILANCQTFSTLHNQSWMRPEGRKADCCVAKPRSTTAIIVAQPRGHLRIVLQSKSGYFFTYLIVQSNWLNHDWLKVYRITSSR